jgi:hypothetical protein
MPIRSAEARTGSSVAVPVLGATSVAQVAEVALASSTLNP